MNVNCVPAIDKRMTIAAQGSAKNNRIVIEPSGGQEISGRQLFEY